MRKNAGALKVKFFILDVDGVMTDGGIIIGGEKNELKEFNVKDGTGIFMAKKAGFKFAVISGRFSDVITVRAKELKIDALYQGAHNKISAYEKIKKRFDLRDSEIAYVGDDIIDIPPLEACGFAAVPADAVFEVKKLADYISVKRGGEGCVRDVVEFVLKKQKLWEKAVKRYLNNED